ncbi:MAG: hypothetical protein M1823_000521 [Watsoniomyces obsoletus]|nr:MAG: hypothetical protein M1823_000521 [Watsoniomyces obsoletus]
MKMKIIILPLFFILSTAFEVDFPQVFDNPPQPKDPPGPGPNYPVFPDSLLVPDGLNGSVHWRPPPDDPPVQTPPPGPLPVGSVVLNDTGPVSTRRSQFIWGEAEWSVGRRLGNKKWSYVAMELDHYPGSNEGDMTYCWAGGDEVARVASCVCKTSNNFQHRSTACHVEYIFDQEHLEVKRPVPERITIRYRAQYWESDVFRRLWLPFLPGRYSRLLDCQGPRHLCKHVHIRQHKRRVSRYNRRWWWRHFPNPCVPTKVYKC